jgi:hypothetical protein
MFNLFRKLDPMTASGWVLCWEPTTINRSSGLQFLGTHPTAQTLRKTPHLSMATMFADERSARKACRALVEKNFPEPTVRRVHMTME